VWLGCLLGLFWVTAASAQSRPKNIILLIGDGLGPEQVRLAREFDADGVLALDRLDANPGLMTTDDVFGEVTDSAASATAMATGYKSYYGAVSVDVDGNPLETALERAERQGKATGIVSSVYVEDATPGVWAAHAADRGEYAGIALQQALAGVEVILGSGRQYYLPRGRTGGQRTDGRDLIAELQALGYAYADTVHELAAIDASVGRLLGHFGGQWTLTYVLDRRGEKKEPTLVDLTVKAIEVLRRDPDGFFLMIEGGAIDWMGHNRDAAGIVAETLEFDAAVQVALDFARADGDTLVVVTGDHETGDLAFGAALDRGFLRGITATTEFMYGLIKSRTMSIADTLRAYAGVADLSAAETRTIERFGMTGIGDVLSARARVSWGWSGKDDGEHTPTLIPVYAYGPGSAALEGHGLDNTDIGKQLFIAISGNWP
jgi:alkaline phosphatase